MAVLEITEQSVTAYVDHIRRVVSKEKKIYINELSVEELLSEQKNPIVYRAGNIEELCNYLDTL